MAGLRKREQPSTGATLADAPDDLLRLPGTFYEDDGTPEARTRRREALRFYRDQRCALAAWLESNGITLRPGDVQRERTRRGFGVIEGEGGEPLIAQAPTTADALPRQRAVRVSFPGRQPGGQVALPPGSRVRSPTRTSNLGLEDRVAGLPAGTA